LFYSTKRQAGISFSRHDLLAEYRPISIGNDVWIGASVIVLDGVKIGTGAIVAAGSVVRQDVAPYTVVAGVPATVKKTRFSEEQIESLLASHWWDWSDEDLLKRADLFLDVNRFIDEGSRYATHNPGSR